MAEMIDIYTKEGIKIVLNIFPTLIGIYLG